MERLTRKVDGKTVFPSELVGVTLTPDNVVLYKLLMRLAVYEDTGLEPGEVHCLWGEWNAMMRVLNSIGSYDRLRELAEADKDGRVVVLPCKVGDTMYFALLGRIIEKQVFSIVSFSNSTRIYCAGTSEYFRPEDIGKTFFLTREEAEAALEEVQNGNKTDM